ncbi:MAG: tail fiber protein [Reichenbachiella sp.]|uniref:tail fiber protein n=1 Tax=Reichenbachiella sp. TaxID=2184521 RepID=UPI0032969464
MKFQIVAFLLILVFIQSVFSQQGIGIGTDNVNDDAILEIDSRTGGLLIPRMTTDERNTINPSSQGLIVFDIEHQAFFYWDKTESIWRKLVDTEEDLDVELGAKSISASDYGLNATGNGPVPKGGIIMWSGATDAIPYGWALCNGRWYNPNDNTDSGINSSGTRTVKTPNLTGRFIVGAGGIYSPDATGGSSSVTLTTTQMPAHTHDKGSLYTNTTGNHRHSTKINNLGLDHKGSATELGRGQDQTNAQVYYSDYQGNHSHTIYGSTGSTDSNGSHENRPPYYALAYILKM